jgi:hypothetical protein
VFDLGDPKTLWLNVTNIALGLVTLICILAAGTALFHEVTIRMRKRALVPAHDDHALFHPDLGLTMADGGEKLDDSPQRKDGDTSNVFRSEN